MKLLKENIKCEAGTKSFSAVKRFVFFGFLFGDFFIFFINFLLMSPFYLINFNLKKMSLI